MRSPASGPEGGAVDSEKQRIVNRETDPLGLNNCIISIGNAHRTDSSDTALFYFINIKDMILVRQDMFLRGGALI